MMLYSVFHLMPSYRDYYFVVLIIFFSLHKTDVWQQFILRSHSRYRNLEVFFKEQFVKNDNCVISSPLFQTRMTFCLQWSTKGDAQHNVSASLSLGHLHYTFCSPYSKRHFHWRNVFIVHIPIGRRTRFLACSHCRNDFSYRNTFWGDITILAPSSEQGLNQHKINNRDVSVHLFLCSYSLNTEQYFKVLQDINIQKAHVNSFYPSPLSVVQFFLGLDDMQLCKFSQI